MLNKTKTLINRYDIFNAEHIGVVILYALNVLLAMVAEDDFAQRYIYYNRVTIHELLSLPMWIISPFYSIYLTSQLAPDIFRYLCDFWFCLSDDISYNYVKLSIKTFQYSYTMYKDKLYQIVGVLNYFNIYEIKQFLLLKFNLNFYLFIEGAWYLKFGYLFFLTTVASLLSLSYLGLYGVFCLNLLPLFLFWISSIFFLKKIFFFKKVFFINFGKWFMFNINQKVNFELYIDYITISFTVLTLTIAMFVYIYCFSYFRYEPNVDRLLLFINLFVVSMILLVSSGNFIVLFLGWEMIGLTSFFLINFWSTRMGTLKAAFKAFVFNKFSDISILISCILCYLLINDFNILVFNNQIHYYINYYINIFSFEISYIELISFFLITAAFIKSAQFGTHIWLPDSMEAPVPASALIHSATLVSAGIYLLLRFSPLFELSSYVFIVLPVIGSFTAFFGGICSAYQSDIKKILAYSTISHCGFLMVSYCTHIAEYTLLYLYIHGFFKAAVFLCVGNIIRFSRNYQDFRRMGGFYKYLPLECIASFLCLINLSGLPFTLGFYIKHILLLGLPEYLNIFILLNIVGGALCGIVYSYRLHYYVFFDYKKAKKIIYIQGNKRLLKSWFYSNTTLASNLAILGLIFFSYIISIYYFNLCLSPIFNKSEIVNFSFTSSNQYEFYKASESTLKNISYINWIILFIILLVYLVKWRYYYKYHFTLKKFYFLCITLIFMYIIYNIICFV